MDNDNNELPIIGGGSLWKVEQTVVKPSWGKIIKLFEQFNSEELTEMIEFFQDLKKVNTRATDNDGIDRGNGFLSAVREWNKANAGASLVKIKHDKNKIIKENIRKEAELLVNKNIKHNKIAKEVYEKGIADGLGMSFVLKEVKSVCRKMNREDLITGLKKKKDG